MMSNLFLDKSHFFIHTPISPDPFPTVIFEAIESKTPCNFYRQWWCSEKF